MMLKRYLEMYAKKKPISPQAISSLSFVFTLFNLSEEEAAEAIVALCIEEGAHQLRKLLFLGSKALSSAEAQAGLQPIRDMIMSTYPDVDVGEGLLNSSQNSIAEAAFRSEVQERAKREGNNLSVVPDGWQLLGLDQSQAFEIFRTEKQKKFLTDASEIYGTGNVFVNAKGQRVDADGKLIDNEDVESGERTQALRAVNAGKPPPSGKVYQCENCGSLVYVSDYKDFETDFPSDYVCVECLAPKSSFQLLEF
eukprot:CAMPEP_0116563338 /NCGR_PEP_ID=MMETSP0397-20121206/12680_1 /TAXON_ID=216820 /ORGANISM="Cyclophora tenuis, Strain ECT3854" /LENGTH=251 /DNA_ID=CAMNT_0004089775 /DNA_START=1 /DNA_END=752 /DNA_ORIENTATION=+